MKKVVNISLADRSFHLDEDAYNNLQNYLDVFKRKIDGRLQKKEVMDDVERRISELFVEKLGNYKDVVNIAMVNEVIMQLGMPDGSTYNPFHDTPHNNPFNENGGQEYCAGEPNKKLFRNPDNRVIGGVSSGLAAFFGIDTVLIRVIFALFVSVGFWIYIILWIVVPEAKTPQDKCMMLGLPVTAANMSRFAKGNK